MLVPLLEVEEGGHLLVVRRYSQAASHGRLFPPKKVLYGIFVLVLVLVPVLVPVPVSGLLVLRDVPVPRSVNSSSL
jgi:hypothetical protein